MSLGLPRPVERPVSVAQVSVVHCSPAQLIPSQIRSHTVTPCKGLSQTVGDSATTSPAERLCKKKLVVGYFAFHASHVHDASLSRLSPTERVVGRPLPCPPASVPLRETRGEAT